MKIPNLSQSRDDDAWGSGGKERSELQRCAKALSKMGDRDRSILLVMAQKMAQQNAKR